MRYILSLACRSILTQLAEERTLCSFDFDGTLAPIAARPDQAGMRDRTRHLLGRVATLYPCVILSGRARIDALSKLNGVRVKRVIGNHGAETNSDTEELRRQVTGWKAALAPRVGSLDGVWIEDKGLSLAVHYRQASGKVEARRRVLEVARGLEQVRVVGGKQVLNLVVAGAPHKGEALASERDRLHCRWVLFVGDDENDEDAFALDGNLVAVRVGRKRQSHARYYLRSQAEIDKLLELLIALRRAARTHPARQLP